MLMWTEHEDPFEDQGEGFHFSEIDTDFHQQSTAPDNDEPPAFRKWWAIPIVLAMLVGLTTVLVNLTTDTVTQQAVSSSTTVFAPPTTLFPPSSTTSSTTTSTSTTTTTVSTTTSTFDETPGYLEIRLEEQRNKSVNEVDDPTNYKIGQVVEMSNDRLMQIQWVTYPQPSQYREYHLDPNATYQGVVRSELQMAALDRPVGRYVEILAVFNQEFSIDDLNRMSILVTDDQGVVLTEVHRLVQSAGESYKAWVQGVAVELDQPTQWLNVHYEIPTRLVNYRLELVELELEIPDLFELDPATSSTTTTITITSEATSTSTATSTTTTTTQNENDTDSSAPDITSPDEDTDDDDEYEEDEDEYDDEEEDGVDDDDNHDYPDEQQTSSTSTTTTTVDSTTSTTNTTSTTSTSETSTSTTTTQNENDTDSSIPNTTSPDEDEYDEDSDDDDHEDEDYEDESEDDDEYDDEEEDGEDDDD